MRLVIVSQNHYLNKIFDVHPLVNEIYEGIIIIIILKNDILPVLGLDSGYTVKYSPPPSGGGLYLTVYPESSPNTDTVSSTFLLCTKIKYLNLCIFLGYTYLLQNELR